MVGGSRRDPDSWVRFVVGDSQIVAEITRAFANCSPNCVCTGNITTEIAHDTGFAKEGKAVTENKEAGDLTSQDVDG